MKKFKRVWAFLLASLILITIFTAVPSGSVSAAVAWQAARVKGTNVNIRSGPSTGYSSYGKVSNVDLYVTGMSGEWFSVTYNGISGYIHYPYITFVPTEIVPQSANVIYEVVNMRAEAALYETEVVAQIPSPSVTITVTGIVYVGGTIWYATTYNGISGYIKGNFVKLSGDIQYPETEPTPEPEPDPDFETQISAFPESYRPYLRTLHDTYPNWIFRADNLAMSYNEAVAGETANWQTKLVNYYSDGVSWRSLADGAYNWDSGTWNKTSDNWVTASREVVMYYMDPRNFLNAKDVYMFLKQGYDSTQTADGVADIVAGTFLANGYSDSDDTAYGGSYINVIMEAARQSGVSPYVLAATLIQEQGVNGTSDLISGTTSYGKYFNFFNIQASGSDVVGNGLEYAKEKGWTTRSASIIGGASFYAKGYISSGQDTYFYKNFDLLSSPYYTHQYAQNIYDSRSSASLIRDTYNTNYNAPLIFRIPVYTSIPETVAEKPVENDLLNNYYLFSMSVDGFSMYNYYYSLSVTGDRVIDVTLPSGATLVNTTPYNLSAGVNTVAVTVRAQTGYTNSYYLTVTADRDCKLYVTPCAGNHTHSDWHTDTPAGNYKTGIASRYCTVCGISETQIISMLQPLTAQTLVNVKREILTLSGNFDADVNLDGRTDVLDLIRFKKMLAAG